MNSQRDSVVEIKSLFPRRRQDIFAADSWGYKDSYFDFSADHKALYMTGKNYPIINKMHFNYARDVFKKNFLIDIADLKECPSNEIQLGDIKFHDNEEFRAGLEASKIDFSVELEHRYFRCHSQAPLDLYILKYVKYNRIPDLVVWPRNHQQVESIVKLANQHNVAIIPVGGLTNVTSATNCPVDETRMIASLDMTQMNRMLWLDKKSMLACFETGVAGQDLERTLEERGFTMGHEPDSIEFSTLGGWIATRSSGIKQQTYGNIEDIVVSMKTVTSIGVLEKNFLASRVSMGPELEHIVLGSEGTLGVITEAVVKIHKLPDVRHYGSLMFPNFVSGIQFLRECNLKNSVPSSLRLLDHIHVQCGLAFKHNNSIVGELIDRMKKMAVTTILGFDEDSWALATYLVEGEKKIVDRQEDRLIEIAKQFGGINAGVDIGERGYFMTFTVGYSRDMFLRLGYLSDSVETSITWNKCESCVENVRNVYAHNLKKLNVQGNVSFRISQVYHDGVCIYLYYGLNQCDDQLNIMEKLGSVIKETVRQSGGSLSHHHGIGKKNTLRFRKALPDVSREILWSLKRKVDPKNIFAAGNLVFSEELQSKL